MKKFKQIFHTFVLFITTPTLLLFSSIPAKAQSAPTQPTQNSYWVMPVSDPQFGNFHILFVYQPEKDGISTANGFTVTKECVPTETYGQYSPVSYFAPLGQFTYQYESSNTCVTNPPVWTSPVTYIQVDDFSAGQFNTVPNGISAVIVFNYTEGSITVGDTDNVPSPWGYTKVSDTIGNPGDPNNCNFWGNECWENPVDNPQPLLSNADSVAGELISTLQTNALPAIGLLGAVLAIRFVYSKFTGQ